MENNINNILSDLYKIDPELKQREDDLIKIINKLIESRPDIKFDEQFARELRAELLERAEEARPQAKTQFNLFLNFMQFKKLAYIAGAAAGVFLLAFSVINYSGLAPNQKLAQDAQQEKIAKLDKAAFGSLRISEGSRPDSLAGQAKQEMALGEEAPDGRGAAEGLGGGGNAAAGISESARMIMPPDYEKINYEYVYAGEELPAIEASMEVYKRLGGKDAVGQAAGALASRDLGLVDLKNFKNTSITNLNIVEDREFGYMLYINTVEGIISINSNWEKWPQADKKCWDLPYPESDNCYQSVRLKASDVPEDAAIAAIADKFLADYGIGMKDYGPGEVTDFRGREFIASEGDEANYVPDTVSVVYPLLINGKPAYDEGGNKTGMSVEVNIRYKKASGIQQIRENKFQSSSYGLETDSEKLKSFAEQGGIYSQYRYPDPDKIITINLDTPELVLMRHWHYDPEKKSGEELYIPALRFSATNTEDRDNFYRQSVMVPLVKDIFESFADNSDQGPGPMPRPMPLLEDAPRIQTDSVQTIEEE